MKKSLLLIATALCGTLTLPSAAFAQAGATDSSDIIVTAQRRAERLEDVPAAVTAISADQVARSGVVKMMDIAQLTSGVQMQKGGYTTQPAVRGISSLTTGVGFENNTAIYIDGFYQPDSVAINSDLANIRQVEILKGPQGTLYGRNATAGAILINTSEPSDTFTGSVSASYARFHDHTVQGNISVPLGDKAALSVAGSYRRSNGYIRDLGPAGDGVGGYNAVPQKNDSLRVKLRLNPAEGLKLTLGYNYGNVLDAVGLSYTIYDKAAASLPASPPRASQRDTVTNNGSPSNVADLNEGTLRAELATGIGTLSLRSSYGRRNTLVAYDFDGSKLDSFRGVIPSAQYTFQQSADYTITAIPNVDLLVGAHYFNDVIRINGQQAILGGAVATTDHTRLTSRAIAAYIDATAHVGELSLTAGLRYSNERKSVSYRQIATTPVPPAAAGASFDGVTPRFVAKYEIGPRTNVYASFSTGFRSGVFQNQVLPNPALVKPISPEKITAYEIGLKTAQRGFRFDMAAFYYAYSNLHVGVTVPNPITGIGVISTITSARAAEVYGLEAQVMVEPVKDLHLTASATILDAKYTDFANATATGYNALTGRNATNQAQDWSGQQMARAPAFSATFQTDYNWAALGGRAQVAVNASYTSSYVPSNPSLYGALAGANLANIQRYQQGRYAIVNAQASWTDPSDRYTVTVFVNNLTNMRFQLVTSGGSFGDYRQYNQPVSAGGRVSVKF